MGYFLLNIRYFPLQITCNSTLNFQPPFMDMTFLCLSLADLSAKALGKKSQGREFVIVHIASWKGMCGD